jgi:hypothetical protein
MWEYFHYNDIPTRLIFLNSLSSKLGRDRLIWLVSRSHIRYSAFQLRNKAKAPGYEGATAWISGKFGARVSQVPDCSKSLEDLFVKAKTKEVVLVENISRAFTNAEIRTFIEDLGTIRLYRESRRNESWRRCSLGFYYDH